MSFVYVGTNKLNILKAAVFTTKYIIVFFFTLFIFGLIEIRYSTVQSLDS